MTNKGKKRKTAATPDLDSSANSSTGNHGPCHCGHPADSCMIECGVCMAYVHYECTGMNLKDVVGCINDRKGKYVCKGCLPQVDSQQIGTLKAQSSVGMVWKPGVNTSTAFAPGPATPPIPKEWMIEITKVATEAAVAAVKESVKEIVSEMFEKQGKKNNLVIVGWPEKENSDQEQEKADLSKIEDYCSKLEISPDSIQSHFRDGAKRPGGSRILKLCFKDRHVSARRRFLFNGSRLMKGDKDFDGTKFRPFVREDRTWNERQLDKELRDEVKKRNENGENLMIRNFKIVPRTNPKNP